VERFIGALAFCGVLRGRRFLHAYAFWVLVGLPLAMKFNELEMKCTSLNRDVRIIACQFRSMCECIFNEYKIDKKLKEVQNVC